IIDSKTKYKHHPLLNIKKYKNHFNKKQAIPKQATLKKQQILQAKQQNLLLNKHKKESGRLTTPFFYLSFGT
ncbi:hypothetical protein ACOYYK_16565, partial [Enterococcus gallinarum]|uniref:hypothetical protein n=1 Tax=Enterococcus gallinarum TaxID=1353 RepID=UPI003BC4A1E4